MPLVTSAESYHTQSCYVLVTLYLPAMMVHCSFVCRR
ncbi:hypothetical protein CGRA01v4_01019 [Colletotrichum graminicola]|nr:hypothetical protein CGRA01v4_01019 [Colletotrichum graminicola]